MPDEMMEKWLEYYDENGLTWLDTGVQAAIKQAFFAGIKAVEQPLAPDAGDVVVSTSSLPASAESTSQAESAPTQRG